MNIRPFDWRDLPTLHRYRNQCLFLDNVLLLTQGPMLAPAAAVLSYLAPATGVFSFLYEDDERGHPPVLAQTTHVAGQTSSHLSFITPKSALGMVELPALFDRMAQATAERGAFHLVADVEEQTEAFGLLRRSGFGIFARQRVWHLPGGRANGSLSGLRRAVTSQDEASVHFLYCNLVPGLVQQVEPPPSRWLRGMVYYRGTELLAYIQLKYGPMGIWAQPFIHPDGEAIAEHLVHLLQNLPYRSGRPVYVCVRTYQSWLEPAISHLGGEPGPLQAVMVRHMTITRRVAYNYARPVLNGTTSDATLPVAHIHTESL